MALAEMGRPGAMVAGPRQGCTHRGGVPVMTAPPCPAWQLNPGPAVFRSWSVTLGHPSWWGNLSPRALEAGGLWSRQGHSRA